MEQPPHDVHVPPPRECGTLTANPGDLTAYLIGGNNYDTVSEISQARIEGDRIYWDKCDWKSQMAIAGRQQHTTVHYRGSLYIFGGCYAFNQKRMVRECTNSVMQFDPDTKTINNIKTYGLSVNTRKCHTAVAYRNQMIVYGGCSENDQIFHDMLAFNLDSHEWSTVKFGGVNVPSV